MIFVHTECIIIVYSSNVHDFVCFFFHQNESGRSLNIKNKNYLLTRQQVFFKQNKF